MEKLDSQEKLIVRELIKDPRISDNQIAIKTNVPLKTVNRKRKLLEEKDFLNYYCYLNNSSDGTGTFQGRSLFIITLKDGITKKNLAEKFESSEKSAEFYPKHIFQTCIGEIDGNAAIITLIESRKQDDLAEIYNAEIVPELESFFWHGCIKRTTTKTYDSCLTIHSPTNLESSKSPFLNRRICGCLLSRRDPRGGRHPRSSCNASWSSWSPDPCQKRRHLVP